MYDLANDDWHDEMAADAHYDTLTEEHDMPRNWSATFDCGETPDYDDEPREWGAEDDARIEVALSELRRDLDIPEDEWDVPFGMEEWSQRHRSET